MAVFLLPYKIIDLDPDLPIRVQKNFEELERFLGTLQGSGLKISNSSGITSTRSDNLVRSSYNSDGIKIQKYSVLTGLWEDKFYVDEDGNINISGNINMTGGSISWDSVTAPSYSSITGSKPPTSADNTYDAIGYNRLTYITSTGIYTGTIEASQINTVGLTAEKIETKVNDIVVSYLYKDTYGGKFKIYDVNGYLNTVIGVESGAADNIAGTLVLLNDSPYDTAPSYDPYRRVELGISKSYDAGVINIRGSNAKARVQIQGRSGLGDFGVIGLRDSAETLKLQLAAGTVSFFNGGNVAIGQTTSSYPLTVNGSTYLNGAVGIGAVPSGSYKLYVNGNAYFTGNITCNALDPSNGVTGAFITADNKTVTALNGIVVSIVEND